MTLAPEAQTTLDLGPQYKGDDPFTRRMRLHQSWYRAAVLRLPPGTGPGAHHTATYGNMLAKDDGARGANFLLPEIAELAARRQAEFPRGIEKHRLFCNMLSSQPMCFNLFAPLALDLELGRAMVSALVEDWKDARVVRVILEHAPTPKAEHLDDATSFDAFVEVENDSGELGFLGIETKLTEPFSVAEYRIDERPAYARWVDHAKAPWRASARGELDHSLHNQLFRNHALALAVRHREGSPYRFGASVVVHHAGDSKCVDALRSYEMLVADGAEVPILDRPLDEIVRRWRPVVASTKFGPWLDEFERRYVDLSGSEALAGAKR